MSKYTTGELAKLCGVSVRTVQYYDSRQILVPSELSEGGRRLYSDADLKRLRVICFLRDAGISINSIGELLTKDDEQNVISVLIEEKEAELNETISSCREKLDMLDDIKKEMRSIKNFTVESIGDIVYLMENKKHMQKLHFLMLSVGIPLALLQWTSVILWIASGIWWLFALWAIADIAFGIWLSYYYHRHVAYICPECHEIFIPTFKEMLFAKHTPTLRHLTCTACGFKGFCVETYNKGDKTK